MSIHRQASSSSSSQPGHFGRPASPSSASFRSANAALPETSSFYQHNIEASRTSLSERRFSAVNSLHREKSTSRLSHNSIVQSLPVDDEIAQGLGEEVDQSAVGKGEYEGDASSTYTGFLPARDKSRQHSILPSSAFFAPRKPPQIQSPLSSLPPALYPNDSQATPSTNHYTSESYYRSDEPGLINTHGRAPIGSMRGREDSIGAASSFAVGRSSSEELDASRQGSLKVDQSAIDAYRHSGARSRASRDPLLDFEVKGDDDRAQDSSFWNQTATKRSKAKAFKSDPATSHQDLSVTGNKRRLRRYKGLQGSNRFFLQGLIMTSDDNPFPFLGSLVIMVVLPVLWFIFVAPFTWHHISPAPVVIFAYIWAIAISSMCVTAWRDPGVLPRDLDPDPPCTAGENGKRIGLEDPLAVPLPRIVRVRNGTDLKVKWCDTCGTYRPPRSSHCRVCDNCVENIDHHCTFLNTCIGRRNYFSFFAFLMAAILSCFIALIFSILHIYYLTRPVTSPLPGGGFGEGKNFGQALKATPLSAVIFFLVIGVMVPLLTLFGYHARLISMNRTTVEQIRINTTKTYSEKPSYDDDAAAHSPSTRPSCFKMGIPGRDPNPFAHQTIFRNVKVALLRPMTAHSWIDRYHLQQHDDRRVNPAFASE
ncbi:hypothetical protein CBS101457_000729 [Exobasidium rhododendri]|nr:hypothetical protein CBS101457_000729 [Exobasidium rhododendri]